MATVSHRSFSEWVKNMRVHLDELPGDAQDVHCVDLQLPDLNAWTVGGRASGQRTQSWN